MQNINNYSFFYLANPISFYTYVPMTPSISDISTPISETAFTPQTSFMFPSNLDQYYINHDQKVQNQERPVILVKQPSSPPLTHQKVSNQGFKLQEKKAEDNFESLISQEQDFGINAIKQQQSVNYASVEQKMLLKKPKQQKKKIEDQDYSPECQKQKKNINKYQINQNRNVVPNEINQVFSFVQKPSKSGYLTTKLFQKYEHPEEFTVKRFYFYQSLLKNRLGHYSNQRSLRIVNELYDSKCQNWSEQEQRFYNKICRILIHHFLHEDSIFIILTSKRMKKDKKSDHLRARRSIATSVDTILKGL